MATTPDAKRTELKIRGINAWEAFKCCVKGRNDASRFIDEVADRLYQNFHSDPPRPAQCLAPSGSVVMPLLRFTRCVPVGRPGVVMFGFQAQEEREDGVAWVDITGFEEPRNATQLQAVTEALRATARAVRAKTEDNCFDCVKKRVWGQKKKRKWMPGVGTVKRIDKGRGGTARLARWPLS